MLVEKSEFGKAQRDMDQAAMFVAQAQQLEPAIPGLMAVALPKGWVHVVTRLTFQQCPLRCLL